MVSVGCCLCGFANFSKFADEGHDAGISPEAGYLIACKEVFARERGVQVCCSTSGRKADAEGGGVSNSEPTPLRLITKASRL
jgi:hypothetical protein